jgi:hypothetical protein
MPNTVNIVATASRPVGARRASAAELATFTRLS